MTDDAVRAITVDLARNQLTLHLGDAAVVHPGGHPAPPTQSAVATLDMGTGGRLLGLDMAGRYLAVSEPAPADVALARSFDAPVTLHFAADGSLTSVAVPRRGSGYEITYPSGNR